MAPISFNGQEYDSPEAMPAEVRRLYELASQLLADQDQDGIPDLFGRAMDGAQPTVIQSTQFMVDGKAYGSLDDLPADARRKYEQALGRLDANRNGIPDFFESGMAASTAATAPPSQAAPTPAAQPGPAISAGWSLGTRLAIALSIVLLVVVVALFFLLK